MGSKKEKIKERCVVDYKVFLEEIKEMLALFEDENYDMQFSSDVEEAIENFSEILEKFLDLKDVLEQYSDYKSDLTLSNE